MAPLKASRTASKGPTSTLGARVISFVEKRCFISIGDEAQPLILAPWQRQEVSQIYDNPAGTRRHILSVARKNQKTTLCACLTLAHLCGPAARRDAELYSSALSRDQAALIFHAAARMVRLNPVLGRIVKVRETAKELYCEEFNTKYRALSADAGRNQGLDPAFVVHDELGQHAGPHSDLYEALELGVAAQRNPLSIIISTQAASDADLLSVLIDDATAGHDPHTTCSLYTANSEIDPFSEQAIRAANPSFDYFQNKDELRAMAAQAQRMPSREADYRRYALNQRITVATPFVSPTLWDSCRGSVAPLNELPVVYAGLDLSSVSDLSAFVMVGKQGEKFHVHCHFWLPEETLVEKSHSDHAPYGAWRAQGHLHTTPGRSIDYDFVAHVLRDLFRQHNIQRVAYDPWNWEFFKPSLLRAGFTGSLIDERFAAFPQTTKSMSPAMANLERLLLDGRLVHGANPILTSCVAHTIIRTDAAGNRAPDKRKATHRIDGCVALIMGLAQSPTQPFVFDAAAMIG
jgi:phage terminase large subunit-like protein